MVQGTGSSVGKSLLVAGLCRIFRQDGYRVAPFKAQNMSLNSGVTPDGAEIGRSTMVQAEAARVIPTADMNPVLLKPEIDSRSQLVVSGRPAGFVESKNFNSRKDGLWEGVTRALGRLREEFDVVVIEGAGSPAEINLRHGDIVNMEVALHAQAPVLLIGDIDKGGVFASLYGTMMLLAPAERVLVKGMVINLLRGDVSILEPGLRQLEDLTGVPVLGVVPYFKDIYVPEEDSPSSQNSQRSEGAIVDVAVVVLPHIANFDDFDPIAREPGVGLRYVRSADELGEPDLVILPGTKTTVADLAHIRRSGTAERVRRLAENGTGVIGICGGYQMLGRRILDPHGVESRSEDVPGLGLLPVVTSFATDKETNQVRGRVLADHGLLEECQELPFAGYEIHMGSTVGDTEGGGPPETPPVFGLTERSGRSTDHRDGWLSQDGLVMGTYMHGLFHNTELRRGILQAVARRKGAALRFGADAFDQHREYDKLADLLRASLDMGAIYGMSGLRP